MMEGYIEEQKVKDEIVRLVERQQENLRINNAIIRDSDSQSYNDVDRAYVECLKSRRAIGVLQYLYENLFHEYLVDSHVIERHTDFIRETQFVPDVNSGIEEVTGVVVVTHDNSVVASRVRQSYRGT